MMKKTIILLIIFSALTVSCSIQKLAINKISDILSDSGGGSALTGDEDPEFVGDALPFALKMYEILLEQNPEHQGLLLTSGMGFIMYANAFIQTPASMLPEEEYEQQEAMMERAKRMYIRGRNYVFRALEVAHPGFLEAVQTDTYPDILSEMTEEDVASLYWAAAGWVAAISINIFDVGLTIDVDKAVALMDRAYEIEPDFGVGMIDDFYILYYSSMPEGMGGSEEKARFHFARAVELSGGNNPSPYVSLATSLSIQKQDAGEFRELLSMALAVDIEKQPENKLANIITQRKARWYLDHIEDFFLLDFNEPEDL
jgi:predicted anti-sigma-YlaC factor YlaD